MLSVTKIPAKILREKQNPITIEEITSSRVKKLIDEMRATMVQANGVGLAANQVGENLPLFVIDKKLATENNVPDIFINPEITDYSRDQDELEEGCLSLPQLYIPVKRSKKIKIKAYDAQGNKIKLKARGFLARVLQHETDHLNGIVIKDRMI